MALSQEEREKFEEDFRYLVDKYVQFFMIYNQLINKSNRTPEEEQEFVSVHQLLLSIGEVLSVAIQALGDDLFGKAIDMYYRFKEIAGKGDSGAQHLIKELQPIFAASLNSRIYKN